MKYVKLKIVQSSTHYKQLSLRGPSGKNQNDSVHEHITNSDFKDGDIVYLISEEDFKKLEEYKNAEN